MKKTETNHQIRYVPSWINCKGKVGSSYPSKTFEQAVHTLKTRSENLVDNDREQYITEISTIKYRVGEEIKKEVSHERNL